MKEMVGGCCVCSDERGWPDNPLVYCDGNGCTVAVHQACYGIVTVPTGPWYCRKCESGETKTKVRCELCPSKSGALKRSDTGGWAHVVCALYIPEVRFGNVTSMEPIVLRLIPPERYNKTCYICADQGKSNRANAGACMQCNKSGCKQQFHVTCAQGLGLLCEEAGNYLDNVKYCGYCQHHYSKLKKGGNVKTIPPYKPVSHDSQSSDSSGEKEGDPPITSDSVTPTHAAKSKGPGRKSSHATSTVVSGSGKSTPTASKTPTNTSQPMDVDPVEVPPAVVPPAVVPPPPGRKQKASEKNVDPVEVPPAVVPPAVVPPAVVPPPPGRKQKASEKNVDPVEVPPAVVPPAVVPPPPGRKQKAAGKNVDPVEVPPAVVPPAVVPPPPGRKQKASEKNVDPVEVPPAVVPPAVVPPPPGRKQKASEKSGKMPQSSDKKKPSASPSRRGSSAGDGGAGSKTSTPAPSPQHTTAATETTQTQSGRASGSSTPVATKVSPAAASPGATKPVAENVGVISSVATTPVTTVTAVTAVTTATTVPVTTASATVTTPVTQASTPKPAMQESVITNVEAMETKQTKKRKAVNAANSAAAAEHLSNTSPARVENPPAQGGAWDGSQQGAAQDVHMEPADKVVKKAKTENTESAPTPPGHFASVSSAPPPPPPPPAHSPASQPSPRPVPSPMPGPSGMNPVANIRSPSQHQGKGERDVPTSLLVSVPLPSTSLGLNLTAHSQIQQTQPEMPGPAPHIFHQPQKQATMDTSVSTHSPHALPTRSWGGLNVAYEMQQDPNKPSMSGMPISGKDTNMASPSLGPMPPTTIRNKKRAAMSSVGAMGNAPPMQTTTQSLASVRRQPQPAHPPIYQETIKDSPPSSPSSERPLKPKMESSRMGSSCTAPHMLGNELNPESGAAACLQEQLTAELAAHAAGTAGADPLIPPPLINKAAAGANNNSGRSSSGAQSLDQLLERQWEQGSQFLMEQAQHFDMQERAYQRDRYFRQQRALDELRARQWDVASLLSCLHQLRTENVRLEDHVGNLQLRRDHLLAVNARLAIPLTTVTSGAPEPGRCQMQRESGAQVRPPPPPVRAAETITSERSHQLLMREVQQKPS